MRIIAGKYRGTKLSPPKSTNIRPTGDKVKQAIFTKLQFFVNDKVVLDLFSGSGALGIEALSRGAKFVYFVDKSRESIALTRKNLEKINGGYKVIFSDYQSALKSFLEPFDLIILDPPYASGVYENCLQIIYEKNLLAKDGIIVCERDQTKPINSTLFDLIDSKNYGKVSVDYFVNRG